MKKVVTAAAILLAATPALAQQTWQWDQQRLGNQSFYQGHGAAEGWTGQSQDLGGRTYYQFTPPRQESPDFCRVYGRIASIHGC